MMVHVLQNFMKLGFWIVFFSIYSNKNKSGLVNNFNPIQVHPNYVIEQGLIKYDIIIAKIKLVVLVMFLLLKFEGFA